MPELNQRNQRELEDYLDYLNYSQKKSKQTISAYRRNIASLLFWLERHQLESGEVLEKDLDLFLSEYRKTHAPASVNQMISSLKSFYTYRVLFDLQKNNPSHELDSLAKTRSLPKYYSQKQVDQVMDILKEDEKGLLEKAIFVLLFSCGLRVSELCSLKLNDIHFEQRLITVIGKGKKTRTIPVNRFALDCLQEYLMIRETWLQKKSDLLFINKKGKGISRNYVYSLIKRLNSQAGLLQDLSPHSLRHGYATVLLNGKADLRVVQELLGHEDISTTQIYTHLEYKKMQENYDAVFDQLKLNSISEKADLK